MNTQAGVVGEVGVLGMLVVYFVGLKSGVSWCFGGLWDGICLGMEKVNS